MANASSADLLEAADWADVAAQRLEDAASAMAMCEQIARGRLHAQGVTKMVARVNWSQQQADWTEAASWLRLEARQ